ncbi:uncharacterized protein LOC129737165 isoform X1 [Falco cherrug]|uniref:uncharacterized protein LOC129737165 isoform X1 n=1 Tax=Falco cherrug TaxID=345164 RepID=UPI00247AB071|nr:uncharacterized protein LOC129737165 isoform X1 [Falco cherrug]
MRAPSCKDMLNWPEKASGRVMVQAGAPGPGQCGQELEARSLVPGREDRWVQRGYTHWVRTVGRMQTLAPNLPAPGTPAAAPGGLPIPGDGPPSAGAPVLGSERLGAAGCASEDFGFILLYIDNDFRSLERRMRVHKGRSLNSSLQAPIDLRGPCSHIGQVRHCWHEIPVHGRRFTVFQGVERKETDIRKWLESSRSRGCSPPHPSQDRHKEAETKGKVELGSDPASQQGQINTGNEEEI